MDIIDYRNSYLAGTWPENNVRFWVESRTRMIDDRTGKSQDFFQCGSCKSEDTFATNDLFWPDNWDFLPIFGPEHGVIFRRKAWLNPNYKTVVPANKLWEGQTYRIVTPPRNKVRLLETTAAMRKATADWLPLVGQTEIADASTGMRAIIEHPIKTMNIEHNKDLYQVDTGPLALPDLSRRYDIWAESLSLAFVAYNAPHFADFIKEQPTAIERDGKEVCKVNHYSNPFTTKAVNRVYAIED